ncbi:hypothetical protein JL720_10868 [Aureococcus anophagefferens]|nr:hypothetical protein JL720_10868 [Aureococcus anophagefferens]
MRAAGDELDDAVDDAQGLQFAAEEDLRADATTPWRLAAASVNGTVAKKKNLDGGKRYAAPRSPLDVRYSGRAPETALIRWRPFMARCFGTDLVNRSGGTKTGPSLAGKIAAGRPFEVVWLSCERDPEAFSSTFAQFPFLAVPFDNDERERALGNFNVSGIPRLVILGPDGRELVNNAVGMSLSIATVDGWMRQAKGPGAAAQADLAP